MDVLNSSPEGPSNKRKAERAPFSSLITASSSGPTNIVSTAQQSRETTSVPDCTACEGRGKFGKKRKVESYNVTRGDVTTQRRGYEKTVWLNCKDCKGKGKEMIRKKDRGRPAVQEKRDGGSDDEEEFHSASEFPNFDENSVQFKEGNHTPTERDCSTCTEEKPIADYGYKLTATCFHAREVCQDCVIRWVETKIGEGEWNTITCPECASLLEYTDISQILTPTSESFKR
jgi:hypothetical protein